MMASMEQVEKQCKKARTAAGFIAPSGDGRHIICIRNEAKDVPGEMENSSERISPFDSKRSAKAAGGWPEEDISSSSSDF
jgi:hypothetical protein